MPDLRRRIFIRPAKLSEAKSIIAGINAICSEDGTFYTTHYVPTPQWEAVLHRPSEIPDHLLAIAEQDENLIGAGRIFPGVEGTLFRHVGELGIFVLKPYRRQGVGSHLLTWMLDWARNSGLEKIVATVLATNEPAIAFFSKHRFVCEGKRQRQFKIGSSYVDELLLAQFLD